jgi:hypothetical protein
MERSWTPQTKESERTNMKHTLTVARFRRAVSLRPALTALLFAAQSRVCEFPSLGKTRAGNFQPLEMSGEIM